MMSMSEGNGGADGGGSGSLCTARALRMEAIKSVTYNQSVGSAVSACMALLVAAAVASGGSGGHGRYEKKNDDRISLYARP